MMKFNWKKMGTSFILSSALALVACESPTQSEERLVDGDELELVYVAWDTGIASTNVVGTILEDIGYDVTTTIVDNQIMWQSVSTGQADAMVAAWLPQTHASQLEEYGDQMNHLGPNFEGAMIGYAVPDYMDVESVEDLTTEADQTIYGIEAGSGTVIAAEEVLEHYPNLEDWEILTSSTGAMTTELGSAIENEDEIVVTGWTPHWKYLTYDLTFLEEPDNIFGQEETIDTFVREGFEDDQPVAHSILEEFYMDEGQMEAVMLDIHEGAEPEEAARNWVDDNQETVAEWIDEAENAAQENE